MEAEKIQSGHLSEALYRHFMNYDYLLSNSFVFRDWESDFMARSKSGYFVEVENKISRGDFFRDFDKGKHELFKALHAGRSFVVNGKEVDPRMNYKGDLICKFRSGKLVDNRYHGRNKVIEGCIRGVHNGKDGYWTNQYDNYYLQSEIVELRAPYCRVQYIELEKHNLPHQFYYCSPAGLLKKEEIPAYAGLLEYNGSNIDMTKKAPYLHKRKMNMDSVMAHKFYNLWRYRAGHGRELNKQS